MRIRLKWHKETKNCQVYSEGYFGGLFRNDIYLDTDQLRQRFGGRVPKVLDFEVTEPGQAADEGREARNVAIAAKRATAAETLDEMQVKGAVERLGRLFNGSRR